MCQLSKVDQKRNWVKLKSVRTLLKITCLTDKSHMWSLFVPVHVQIDQNKLKSIQILLEITSIVPRKLYLLLIYTNSYDNIHDAGNTAH